MFVSHNKKEQVLEAIYTFRGLTKDQLIPLIFTDDDKISHKEYCRTLLIKMKREELIFSEKYGDKYFYFLTTKGINIIKNIYGLGYVLSNDKKGYKKNYYTSSELFFKERISNHQYYLNNFIIDFIRQYPSSHYKLISDKEIHFYTDYVKPDSILEFDDCYVFLEMDMGTENGRKLNSKWSQYRDFLNSSKYFSNPKKILVLFFIKCKNIDSRTLFCFHSCFSDLYDKFDDNFIIYFGSMEKCFNILSLINNKKLSSVRINDIIKIFQNKGYENKDITIGLPDNSFYCRKLREGKILKLNGIIQEYIVMDMRNLNTLNFKQFTSADLAVDTFINRTNRIPRILIIISDEDDKHFITGYGSNYSFIKYSMFVNENELENI